ncbi:MAG: hypothetical protein EPO08_03285 [Rhodospirillaceae bacterium]|nr:MAG: hypothetical protein EPO08_03285 [Rhodospirillaceae bacterium]
MIDPQGHIRPSKIAIGINGSDGLVLGFVLPGDKITTYWISLDDARELLAALPAAISEAESARV